MGTKCIKIRIKEIIPAVSSNCERVWVNSIPKTIEKIKVLEKYFFWALIDGLNSTITNSKIVAGIAQTKKDTQNVAFQGKVKRVANTEFLKSEL